MEIQFENRYFSNHKMLAEFARKYGVGPRPVMVLICVVIFLFFVVKSYVNGILLEMIPMLAFMALVFGSLYFLPHLFAWSTLRNAKKQNDGVLPETVIAFGETIEMHEGMVHLTIEYRKIVRVVRLKHSYMLMLGKHNGVIIDPNGFTKGSFEEFKGFLREKRPDLTIPE